MTKLTDIEYHTSNYETHSPVNSNRSYISVECLLTKLKDLKEIVEINIFTISEIQDASINFYNNLFDLYKTINSNEENCKKQILKKDLCDYIRFSINLFVEIDATKVKYEKKLKELSEKLIKNQEFELDKLTVINIENISQNLSIDLNNRIIFIEKQINNDFKRIKTKQNDFFGVLLKRYDKSVSERSNNKLAIFEEIVEMNKTRDLNNNIDSKTKNLIRINYLKKLTDEMCRFFKDEVKMIQESNNTDEELKNYVNNEGVEKLNQKNYQKDLKLDNSISCGANKEITKKTLKGTLKSKIPLSIMNRNSLKTVNDITKNENDLSITDKKRTIIDLEDELQQAKKLISEQQEQIEKYKKDIKNLENQVKRKAREKESVSKRLREMAKENENNFQRYQFEKRKAIPSRKIFDCYNQLVFIYEELVYKYFLYQENSSRLYYELSGADINYKKVVLYRELDKNLNRNLLENASAGLKMIFSKDNLNHLTLKEYERFKDVRKLVKKIEDLLNELY